MMDSLIATFLTLILTETGDRTQLLAAAIALRYGNDRSVIAGFALASLANCLIAAFAGSFVDQWISQDPLRLFNGLAYFLAGTAMLAWRRRTNLLERWKIGPFATAFLGVFILQFGDKGMFVIGANAAMADHWLFPAIGGWLGSLVAVVPAILLKERLAQLLPLRAIRIGGGIALTAFGLFQALGAWRII
ncbi:MAG: TMEM165/GDT1 family protein [Sphingorhabdus sp.]